MAFFSYNQDLLGVLFLLLVSHPTHFDVKSTTMLSNICLLLCWWKKVGFFSSQWLPWTWVVKRGTDSRNIKNENGNRIESIAKVFVYGLA